MSKYITIDIKTQQLALIDSNQTIYKCSISTAKNGPGEEKDSYCTPRGRHYIRAMIGSGMPCGTVFKGRRPTGEIYTPDLGMLYPDRDWILTRIIWLSGLEVGYNRLKNVDTFSRYIYIHGTPDTEPMGVPSSHGCIRLRNEQIEILFEHSFFKMLVYIT